MGNCTTKEELANVTLYSTLSKAVNKFILMPIHFQYDYKNDTTFSKS